MKHFSLAAILLLLLLQLHAQVANDDCQTANEAGIMDGTQTFNAYNGALFDTCIIISNVNATTSFPYLYTTATCGNYHPNGINTDVWIKFASHNMFSITGMTPIGNTSFDSVSITFWRGGDCSTMQAIGNFQYSLNTMGYFYDTIRANSFAIIDTFYAQISGLHLQDTGAVYLCFRGLGAYQTPSAACYPVNATTDTICSTYTINKTDAGTGNNGSISINMLGGNAPFTFVWGDGNTDSIRNNLAGGWYYVTITDTGGCAEMDSVGLYFTCTANVHVTHTGLGNYTFTSVNNISANQHYVWIIGNDTILQDSTASVVSYRFDTAGTYPVCLKIVNDFLPCTYDTCFQLTVTNASYVPLLDSINIWHYTNNVMPVIPNQAPLESRSNPCGIVSNQWYWQNNFEYTEENISIDSIAYKTLWYGDIYSHCLMGYIREEAEYGRVYFKPNEDSVEMLIYNFGMAEGETIAIPSDPRANPSLTQTYRLDSIRPFTAEHTASTRRQFYLKAVNLPNSRPLRWVEGIGTLYELLYPYVNTSYGGGLFSCPEYEYVSAPQILTCYEHEDLDFYDACALGRAQQSPGCFNYIDTCNYYNICGGIEDMSAVANIEVFPNPAKTEFTLHLQIKQSNTFSVRIADMHGRYVSEITALGRLNEGEHNRQIKIAALPAGLYFIECSTAEGRLYKKLVIE